MDGPYAVYIAELDDGRLYVGITHDLDRRILEHQLGSSTRTTRIYGFQRMLYTEPHPSLESAAKRERQLKRWSHARKLALMNGDSDELKRLARCRNRKF